MPLPDIKSLLSRVLISSGDIPYRSPADVIVRVPIGITDQLLQVQADGTLAWATVSPGGVTPSDAVIHEEAFGQSGTAGSSSDYSRGDHTHGSPTNPIAAHVADGDPHPLYALDTEVAAGYAPIAKGVTGGDSHDHVGGDGNQIDHVGLANKGTNTHAQLDSHLASTSNPHSVTAAQAGALATAAFSGLAKVSVGTSQPGTPSVGDLWVDTN